MAKKKSSSSEDKFYEFLPWFCIIVLPIVTFFILWNIATPETIPKQNLGYAETMDFYWTDALFQTLLIWIPILGFGFAWADDQGLGSGIATAVGLFVGTLVGGFLLKMVIEILLTTYYA